MIERDKLGALSKVGQGGQGVVYRAPNAKTTFAASMVYKEYKPQVLAEIDFGTLATMPALVEGSLTYGQAERLIEIAAWPCRIVETAGVPTGFVMPAIPDQFVIELITVKGASPTTAEFQHLLNHPSMLAARGIDLDDVQRCTLLREAAAGLAVLHGHGVCVGDVSPKNLLFSLTPREAVYFIDCDAMRIDGVSALPQVETPGWEVPPGEELATIHSDAYKLGLLALRLLVGDQDTKDPDQIPATTPALLRQIITDALTKPPERRPLPEAWNYVLGHAIEECQHHLLATPTAPVRDMAPPPPVPTVRARPPVRGVIAPPAQPPALGWPPHQSIPAPVVRPRRSSRAGAVGFGLIVVVLAALSIAAVKVAVHNSAARSASKSTHVQTYAPTPTSAPIPTSGPTPTSAPAPWAPTSTYEPTYVPPPPPPPPPADEYAVIAMSSNGATGGANNYSSLEAATERAMSECQARGPDCKRVASSVNGCVAAAWNPSLNPSGYGGNGPTKSAAERQALANDHGGSIVNSFCTGGL